jgi:hypothetical protein
MKSLEATCHHVSYCRRSSSSDKSMYKLESVDESDMNGSTTVFIDKRDGELKQVCVEMCIIALLMCVRLMIHVCYST